MKTSNKNILNLMAYVALILIAFFVLIQNLLPAIGVDIGGAIINIIKTIEEVLILLVIAFTAYNFVQGKKKAWKIIYWIAIALFIVGVIFIWIRF